MKKLRTYGTITDGKLYIHKRKQFMECLSSWKNCRVEVIIKKIYKGRSIFQNAYYWGVIVNIWQDIIKEEWGELWDIDTVHSFLKHNFNSIEVVNETTGEVFRKPKSTTEHSTMDQEDYHSRCRDAAWDNFGVDIPLPNSQGDLF